MNTFHKLIATAAIALASFSVGAKEVCTEVQRPGGGTALACKNIPDAPPTSGSTQKPPKEGVQHTQNVSSASKAEAVSTSNSSSGIFTEEKENTFVFAPPASTTVPTATSMCTETDSNAVSLLIFSWSTSDQKTSKFCGYMHLYHEYTKFGLFGKALEMLEKAEKSME